jgi:hypothetical protein
MTTTEERAPVFSTPQPHRSRRIVASSVALLSLAAPLALGACSSDSKSSDNSSAQSAAETSVKPEDVKVDDATVTAGLTKMPATIAAAIAAIGTPDAKAKLDAIEEEWASFEGTIRGKEQDLYLQIEDQLTPLQRQIAAGDSATATTTATTMSALFTQYLAKHP